MKKKFVSLLIVCFIFSLLVPPVLATGENTIENGGIKYAIVTENDLPSGVSWPDGVTNAVEVAPSGDGNSSTYSGSITIPTTITNGDVTYTVIGIGRDAFREAQGMTSLTLPDGLKYIREYSLMAAGISGQMTTLTIPASVEYIGQNLFTNAPSNGASYTAITSLTFADNSMLKAIAQGAFTGAQFTSLELPEGLETIGGMAFAGSKIENLTIPASVTNLSKEVFSNYSHTDTVSIADGNENYCIQDGIFYSNTELLAVLSEEESVTVPEGITSISEGTFKENTTLKSITLPSSLTNLGESAFEGCTSLETIDLSNVKEIGDTAFYNCSALETVEFSDDLTTIGASAFEGCKSLKAVDIPSGVTEIPALAFCGCVSLESISLPEGIKSIGEYAFDLTAEDSDGNFVNENPQLAIINIPSTVTELGDNFLGGLKENGGTILVSNVADPSIFTDDVLAGISGDGMNSPTLYYPASAKDAYESENSKVSGFIPPASGDEEATGGFSLSLNSSADVIVGESANIGTSIVPSDAQLVFTPATNDYADLSLDANGNIVATGKKAGSVEIAFTIRKGGVTFTSVTKTISVTSATVSVTGVSLNKEEMSLAVGGSETLTATVAPENATNKAVTWTSSDTSVATVENGVVTAVGNGTATITATAGEKSATCTVTVSTYSSGGGGTVTPAYSITTPKVDNGSVTVSPRNASKGTTVTITVKPDDGYELDELIVTDKNGNALKLTDKGNGKYTFTMPGSKVEIEASFVEIEEPIVVPEFTDVPADAYYADAVEWAVKNGITNGTSATTFSPDAICTRAQVVTFLWRAAGCPAPKAAVNPFMDVQSGMYYSEAVLWAVENGLTNGTSATTFSPDEICSRAQIVTFLWRSENLPAASTVNSFVDVDSSAYYAGAVEWAAENRITVGTNAEGTMFSPDEDCTRAQIVTFLYRAMA